MKELWIATVALVALGAGAADMCMTWTLLDGKTETETRPLAEKNGVLSFRVAQGEIRAKGAKRLEFLSSALSATTATYPVPTPTICP